MSSISPALQGRGFAESAAYYFWLISSFASNALNATSEYDGFMNRTTVNVPASPSAYCLVGTDVVEHEGGVLISVSQAPGIGSSLTAAYGQ